MQFLLHHLLTKSADRFPDKEAVRFKGQGLTYSQLEARTNQVARTLQAAGVRRGDRVGIYVHKSFASVLAVFGILKAGAVYVPLDPDTPSARLAYITNNCDIKTLLTSTEKLAAIPDILDIGTPLKTLVLTDGDPQEQLTLPETLNVVSWAEILEQGPEPLPSLGAVENDLAYILYTSGSTGEPKGVMISHRAIFIFINWCVTTFRMIPDDRVTSHAPLHFDLSTFDIYATIKAGGTIVVVPEGLTVFPVRLANILQEENVTLTYLVPSALTLMVNYGQLTAHSFPALRAILFAGEVFPIKYLRKLIAAIPEAEYYNLYGPTETNVCTYYKVQPEDLEPDRSRPLPIGVACENVEVFAVDEDGQLINQPGIEGDLWVRGSCVADGYWGDTKKTDERFVQNPFQPNFKELVYRTGDVVVLDDDGVNWQYVGRRDHMVKSRGYRIELGEIEAALYRHKWVKEVAAVAIPDDLIGNRIQAYVVPQDGKSLTAKDLELHCREYIPRYMIPESFEFSNRLPKTSTGKIDRPQLARASIAEARGMQ